MKVLVTGGAGFIGSHIAEYFAKEGHGTASRRKWITADAEESCTAHSAGRSQLCNAQAAVDGRAPRSRTHGSVIESTGQSSDVHVTGTLYGTIPGVHHQRRGH